MIKKPMLAEDVVSFDKLVYPLYGSFKVDGVRALMREKTFLPRSLKTFGNKATVSHFMAFASELDGMEGELTLGPDPAPVGVRLCNLTSSAMSSFEGAPDIHWWIFDLLDESMTFEERVAALKLRFRSFNKRMSTDMKVHLLEQRLICNAAEAEAFEHEAISRNYEGIVLKSPTAKYKAGRSTLKEQAFLRVKRFSDAEAEILEYVEQMKNNNEATTSKLGHTTRSSHKANKAGKDTLGAMKVRILNGPFKGVECEIGTGWTKDEGDLLWRDRATAPGKIVKFTYFGHGCKEKPRFSVFQSFRDPSDM